ncbi:MAG: lysophospholipid acyltransferase family protein [Caldisericaceae bacterium]
MLTQLYNLGIKFVRYFPQGFVYGTARFLGFMSFLFDRKRKNVLKNLAVFTGEKGIKLILLGIEFYINFALNIADYFILEEKGLDKIKILTPASQVKETLEKLKGKNVGVVVPTAHLGNWEVAGAFVGSLGFRAHGIGLPQQEKGVEKFYKSFRERYNVIVHPFQTGFIGAYKGIKVGDVATIVSDRDINKDGICVQFFGRNVTFPKGASVLSYRTKARSIFAMLVREKGGYKVYFSQVFKLDFNLVEKEFIEDYVKQFAKVLEDYVKKYPTQFFHFFDYLTEYKC